MTTFSDMINEVSMNLSGYTLQQDRATYLKAAITTTTSTSASPLIISLGSTENLGKGIIEIDEELLWVDSYDRVGGTAMYCTVWSWLSRYRTLVTPANTHC
jgi:hypothetical protein